MYVLTVYGVPLHTQSGPIFIKNNDQVLCQGFITTGTGYEAGTCTAVAQLAIGDSVRVTGDSADPATIQDAFSGFTGHIISDNLTT